MANYMLIRHKVRDYLVWKDAYNADLPHRVEAGLAEIYLLRGAKNSNEIVLLFEAKDPALAEHFSESAELRDTMQKAGVIDKPDIYSLSDIA